MDDAPFVEMKSAPRSQAGSCNRCRWPDYDRDAPVVEIRITAGAGPNAGGYLFRLCKPHYQEFVRAVGDAHTDFLVAELDRFESREEFEAKSVLGTGKEGR